MYLCLKQHTNKSKDDLIPAFLTAAEWRFTDGVMQLINAGIDINSKDQNGSTALILAVLEGGMDIVKYLCTTDGIDINDKNQYGNTALEYATRYGRKKMIKVLKAAGAQ